MTSLMMGKYDIGPDVKWKASGNTSELMDREREILEGEDAEDIIRKKRRELEDEERLEDGMYHGTKSYKKPYRQGEGNTQGDEERASKRPKYDKDSDAHGLPTGRLQRL